MIKLYVTFGQCHVHSVSGVTLDKDCLYEIKCKNEEEGHKKAFDLFNGVFATTHTEDRLNDILEYFPRGIIKE